MKTAMMLVAAVLGTLAAVPAGAQEGGAIGYPAGDEPPPSPPDYAFGDGEVYVGGDSVVGCREFVEQFDEGYDEWGDQAQAGRVLERCEQAGSPSLRAPAEVRQEVRQDARRAVLPETGGVAPLLTAGLLLTAAASVLALRKAG